MNAVILVLGVSLVNGFHTCPSMPRLASTRGPTASSRPTALGLGRSRAPTALSVKRGRSSVTPAPAPPAADGFFAPEARTPARTLGIFALWAALIGYVAVGAPGRDEAAQALDADLLAKLIANPFDPSCPPLFTVLFNFMGIWPAAYAGVLLPGAAKQTPVPAAPFVLGSVAFGMFALSPYLALRRYTPGGVVASDANAATRWFEGKLNAGLLLGGALALSAFGATANGGDVGASFAEYKALFDSQLFVHVTTLDFCALWLLFYGPLVEDMRRRGMDEGLAPLFAAVPIFGATTYLLVRPPLPEAE